jgi:TRAP-type C4-dicarboxylate transport system permease small subunit
MTLLQLGLVFGQVNRQPPPQQGDPAEALGVCMCYGVILVLGVIIHIFFLLTLSKTLAQCSPRNRTMEPGQVWLNLIPFFNLVWMFITIIRISESLEREYRSRGMRVDDPDFGKMMGILYMVFNFVCGLVALIFFIIYWAKIAGYKNELMNSGRGRLEDDYDDRPRRRRRDDDDYEDDRRDDEY